MYKLLVVEDEDVIRNGIVNSIDWHELGFTMMGGVSNGREAITRIGEQKPDVVLTDVRMPVMDGLELSKWINENYEDIRILILSGFTDFEYAKSAIKFKVFEYLLKPTNKKIFMKTFMCLKEEMDNDKSRKELFISNKKRMKEGLYKLREEFLSQLLDGEVFSAAILKDKLNYLELGFNGESYIVSIIQIDADIKNYPVEWRSDKGLLTYSMSTIINDLMDETNCGFCIVKSLREIILLFNVKGSDGSKQFFRRFLDKAIDLIRKKLISDSRIGIYAGIGLTYPTIGQISRSYEQAQKVLEKKFFGVDDYYFSYEERLEPSLVDEKQWIKDYPADIEEILYNVVNGKNIKVTEHISRLFSTFKREKVNAKHIKNYSYILCYLLVANISDLLEPDSVMSVVDSDYEVIIKRCSTIDMLEEYITETLLTVVREIKKEKESSSTGNRKIIDEVKSYIDKNYSQDISLDEVSSKVSLSPSYLSYLFKNASGETYTEYLQKARMKGARRLLRRSDLKVYEIAGMVGYNEYKYFSQQFKKIVGMTPGDYREGR